MLWMWACLQSFKALASLQSWKGVISDHYVISRTFCIWHSHWSKLIVCWPWWSQRVCGTRHYVRPFAGITCISTAVEEDWNSLSCLLKIRLALRKADWLNHSGVIRITCSERLRKPEDLASELVWKRDLTRFLKVQNGFHQRCIVRGNQLTWLWKNIQWAVPRHWDVTVEWKLQ